MPTDGERREMFDALEGSLGERPAGLIMDALALADLLRADIGMLRAELAELRGEVRADIGTLRGEMAELRGEMAELRAEVRAQVPRLALANLAMAFATAGLVLTAAKLA